MSVLGVRNWTGIFDSEESILAVTSASRLAGFDIVDVYSPYAVHGLDEAMGLRRSWMPWVCFVCGLLGAVGMWWLATWALAVDWPSNIGGKPLNSFPAIVPIIFEMVVLCGGYGVIFALLIHCRLLPGRKARLVHPRITDDRFAIVLRAPDATRDPRDIRRLLEEYGALEIATGYEEVDE